MKPIWYFVGLILTVMGLILVITGIISVFNPPANPKVLSDIHPDIWWGALMVIIGLIYVIKNKNVKIE